MAKKLPGIPLYKAADIDWHLDTKPVQGVVEISTLTRNNAPSQNWKTRIYPDAADIGFHVIGRTRTLLFTLIDTDQTHEETLAWHFRNDETGIVLTVLND
jgi:hypothetical protein